MVTIDDIIAVLFVFQAIFLVLTTGFVLYSGFKKKMKNVLMLGTGFFFVSTAILGVIAGSTFDDMQNVYNLGLVAMAIFVRMTFYREVHSGYRFILTSVIVLYIAKIFSYNVFQEEGVWFYVDTLAQTFLVVLPIIYYGRAALNAYSEIKDKKVIPHVSKRLQIMGYAAYFAVFGNLPIWILEVVTGTPYDELPFGSAFVILLVTITSLAFSVGMFLSWVMPGWFKSYLNRDYKGYVFTESEATDEPVDAFSESEQEELDQIDSEALTSTNEMVIFLGEQLSEISGVKKKSSRGLIRFSVRDYFSTIPSQIQFSQWQEIIDNHLEKRLEKFVKDPNEVTRKLHRRLVENQSVITMITV